MFVRNYETNAAGPQIVTTSFAHASHFRLYLSLSAFTLLALVLFLREHAEAAALAPPP